VGQSGVADGSPQARSGAVWGEHRLGVRAAFLRH
jgi:hypothetical protein